jgi:hypothetical protein
MAVRKVLEDLADLRERMQKLATQMDVELGNRETIIKNLSLVRIEESQKMFQ